MQMELMTNRANCMRVIQWRASQTISARVDSGTVLSELPRRLKMQHRNMDDQLVWKMKISIRLEENRDDSTTVLIEMEIFKYWKMQLLDRCLFKYNNSACNKVKMGLGMRVEFKYYEKTMEREGLCDACESKLSGQRWNGSNASCDDKENAMKMDEFELSRSSSRTLEIL